MKILRRPATILSGCLSSLVTAAFAVAAAPADVQRPPNILLILVDDVGYGDVGAFAARLRGTSLPTDSSSRPRASTGWPRKARCSPSFTPAPSARPAGLLCSPGK